MPSKLALRYMGGGSATQKPPAPEVQQRNLDKDAEQVRHNRETERIAQMRSEAEKAARDVQRQAMEVHYADFMLKLATAQKDLTLRAQQQEQAAGLLKELSTGNLADQTRLLSLVAKYPHALKDTGVREIVGKLNANAEVALKAKVANDQHQAQLADARKLAEEQKLAVAKVVSGPTGVTVHFDDEARKQAKLDEVGKAKAKADAEKAIPNLDKRMKAEFGVSLSQVQDPAANMRRANPVTGEKDVTHRDDYAGSHYAFDVAEKVGADPKDRRTVLIPMDRFKAYADEYEKSKTPPPAGATEGPTEAPFTESRVTGGGDIPGIPASGLPVYSNQQPTPTTAPAAPAVPTAEALVTAEPTEPETPKLNPLTDDVAAAARAAIAAGRDGAAVRKRLEENGYDHSSL